MVKWDEAVSGALLGIFGLAFLTAVFSKPKCPRCNSEINYNTQICPSCGCELKWNR